MVCKLELKIIPIILFDGITPQEDGGENWEELERKIWGDILSV